MDNIVELVLDPGEGSGAPLSYKVKCRTPIALPCPNFIPPEGKQFYQWLSIDSGNYYSVNYNYQPYREKTILKAIYKNINDLNSIPKIIFIGGASRSGKSTLLKKLKDKLQLPDFAIVHCDDYFDIEKIKQLHFNTIFNISNSSFFKNFLNSKKNISNDEMNEIKNFKNQKINSIIIPKLIEEYIRKNCPENLKLNFETDDGMNWEECSNDLKTAIKKAKEKSIPFVLVEGFRLLQERYPIEYDIFPDFTIFVSIQKNLCFERKLKFGYSFEQINQFVWPEYIKAHRYLPDFITNPEKKNEFKKKFGGKFLLLESEIPYNINDIIKIILNCQETPQNKLNQYAEVLRNHLIP